MIHLLCGCKIYERPIALQHPIQFCNLHKAAPELYEALKMAIEALKDHNIDEAMAGEFEILTDALAKAEGK